MYTRRVQIENYGPIPSLDIELPFSGDQPKPIILVGANGSGKSIFLSHIVNGLVVAKGIAYPDSSEVDEGRVYKLRSSSYIRAGREYYFARVDFNGEWHVSELRPRRPKQDYEVAPEGILGTDAEALWERMSPESSDTFYLSLYPETDEASARVRDAFAKNCVLFFPSDRSELPAWLNQVNLTARVQHLEHKHVIGRTIRTIVSPSPLYANQNWLYDLIYDRASFELNTPRYRLPAEEGNSQITLPVFAGYAGDATTLFDTVTTLVRTLTTRDDARFGVGRRNNRVLSIESGAGQLVSNVFHLSSGEVSILNIALSILRDFDLTGAPFRHAGDVRGVVVVDEIDLHLHSAHQHEILPKILRHFPGVQFVLTTHSPLFVLGMEREYGEDGIAVYRLPTGEQISAEEFDEFGRAYVAFTETETFAERIRSEIESSAKPILVMEGPTDIRYLETAARLLEQEELLNRVRIMAGDGHGKMDKFWGACRDPISGILSQRIVLLYDCDKQREAEDRGTLTRRSIPLQDDNPVKTGIENLFEWHILNSATEHKPAFVDIVSAHQTTIRGQTRSEPEQWRINKDEKSNLCDWICENASPEDFSRFEVVFELLRDLFGLEP